MRPLDCVLFDCDGTLVDSEHLGNSALAEVLRDEGILEDAVDLTVRYRGGRLATILADLETIHGARFGPHLEPRYRALVAELFETRLRPIPGVSEALSRIATAKCVASGGPMVKIRQALRISGLARHFGENLFSSYDVGSWKPDPGLFLFAARAMNAAPAACAVVEDTWIGIEAALAAGMRPFFYKADGNAEGATAGGGDRAVEASPRVTAFQDMAELPNLLGQ